MQKQKRIGKERAGRGGKSRGQQEGGSGRALAPSSPEVLQQVVVEQGSVSNGLNGGERSGDEEKAEQPKTPENRWNVRPAMLGVA